MTYSETTQIEIINKSDIQLINTPIILKSILNDCYETILNEFKCVECNQLVYKKEIYQCKNGDPLCKLCFEKQIELYHECKVCKVPILSIEELSKCKFYENSFANKKINCPFSLCNSYSIVDESETTLNKDSNGCGDIIKIGELESHMVQCEKRFVSCKSQGCDRILRYYNLQHHIDECGYTIVNCQHCSIEVIRSNLELHYNECPSIEIECHQCHQYVKRGILGEHIRVSCLNTKIVCRYSSYGCSAEFERYQLDGHLDSVNHTKFITNCIEKQQDEIQKLVASNLTLHSVINEFRSNQDKQKQQVIPQHQKFNNPNIYHGYWVLDDYSTNTAFTSPVYNLNSTEFSFSASNLNFSIALSSNSIINNFCVKFTIINSNHEYSKRLTKTREFKKGFKSFFLSPFIKGSFSSENGFITDDNKLVIKFTVELFEKKNNNNNNNNNNNDNNNTNNK